MQTPDHPHDHALQTPRNDDNGEPPAKRLCARLRDPAPPRTTLGCLPAEILIAVFKCISTVHDLACASRVSATWHDIADASRAWDIALARYFPNHREDLARRTAIGLIRRPPIRARDCYRALATCVQCGKVPSARLQSIDPCVPVRLAGSTPEDAMLFFHFGKQPAQDSVAVPADAEHAVGGNHSTPLVMCAACVIHPDGYVLHRTRASNTYRLTTEELLALPCRIDPGAWTQPRRMYPRRVLEAAASKKYGSLGALESLKLQNALTTSRKRAAHSARQDALTAHGPVHAPAMAASSTTVRTIKRVTLVRRHQPAAARRTSLASRVRVIELADDSDDDDDDDDLHNDNGAGGTSASTTSPQYAMSYEVAPQSLPAPCQSFRSAYNCARLAAASCHAVQRHLEQSISYVDAGNAGLIDLAAEWERLATMTVALAASVRQESENYNKTSETMTVPLRRPTLSSALTVL